MVTVHNEQYCCGTVHVNINFFFCRSRFDHIKSEKIEKKLKKRGKKIIGFMEKGKGGIH